MHRIEGSNVVNGLFSDGPPGTTVTAAIMNAIQEELANVIESAGFELYTQGNDPRNQLWQAIQRAVQGYDYVVYSQESFVNLWERTSANNYKIKDNIKSVYFKNIVGGYGASNILSDSDTYAIMDLNVCRHVEFENGAYINVGITDSYVKVTADDMVVNNLEIRGDTSSACSAPYSFFIDVSSGAVGGKYTGIKVKNRKIDVTHYCIRGNAVDNTSNFSNCSIKNISVISTANITGFYICKNMVNCSISDITAVGSGSNVGFHGCNQISNCYVNSITAESLVFGFYDCNQISNCYVNSITSNIENAYGFYDCDQISNCYIESMVVSTGQYARGFHNCDQISSCKVYGITTAGIARGFSSCNQISGCSAESISSSNNDAYGYYDCENISGCYVNSITSTTSDARGFSSCNQIAGCSIGTITAGGTAMAFYACNYGAAIYAPYINTNCDGIDSQTAGTTIPNKYSVNGVFV